VVSLHLRTLAREGRMTVTIGRRELLAALGGAAAAWPLAARAQQRIPRVGFLFAGTPSLWSKEVAAFAQRLGELGWIEGRTVAIEYRWVESRTERLAAAAAEFVELKVDVIVTPGTAVPAVKQVTSVIPIVFPLGSDPVASGFVASLARPGGNVTGMSVQSPDLAGKRVELLREVLPGLRGLAIMGDAAYAAAVLEMGEVEVAARKLGLDTARVEIRRAEDIAPAIAALKGHADALYACAGALVVSNTTRISSLASTARLPTIYPSRPYLAGGGFMSYGPNYPDLFRRAAEMVDKILHGAKPADIPVEQPTKFDLVINLTTAKALGLTIPESFLLRADELIE
jgi:putative tryptophan/tyrosine transport system substrate-binding protein